MIEEIFIGILIVFGVIIVLPIFRSIFTIQQAHAGIIERFGKFNRVVDPGLHVKFPYIDRLVALLRRRVTDLGVSCLDDSLGVLVVAIGTSDLAANARTRKVAPKLLAGTSWAGATTAFATHAERSLAEALGRLRRQGAHRVVIAPWFLAPGRIPDRVQRFADKTGIEMAAPLGAHRLVAETVLDRFAEAAAGQIAA